MRTMLMPVSAALCCRLSCLAASERGGRTSANAGNAASIATDAAASMQTPVPPAQLMSAFLVEEYHRPHAARTDTRLTFLPISGWAASADAGHCSTGWALLHQARGCSCERREGGSLSLDRPQAWCQYFRDRPHPETSHAPA